MIAHILIFFWNRYLFIKNKFLFKFKHNKIRLYKKWDRSKPGLKLTFMDDFNMNQIKNYWRTDSFTGQRYDENKLNEKHIEFYSDNLFNFNSTTIMLKSQRLPKKLIIGNNEYKSDVSVGQLDSSLHFMQTHGYFEFRVRMPKSLNIKPEIKLHSLLTGSKINIVEYNGDKCRSCFSVGVNNKTKKINMNIDLSKNFFIYGLNWDEKYLKFYFQDILVRVVKKPKDFVHPMHIILKNGINYKSIEGTVFPNSLDIDYVRVYKNK